MPDDNETYTPTLDDVQDTLSVMEMESKLDKEKIKELTLFAQRASFCVILVMVAENKLKALVEKGELKGDEKGISGLAVVELFMDLLNGYSQYFKDLGKDKDAFVAKLMKEATVETQKQTKQVDKTFEASIKELLQLLIKLTKHNNRNPEEDL